MSEIKTYQWGTSRRFNAFSDYTKKQFGSRVQKLTIDAGFTCPNRDGSKGRGGCTYCNNDAFNPSYCQPQKSIREQISTGIEFHRKRYAKAKSYLAYFQAYSNTYAEVPVLKKYYEEALENPEVTGLVIGTRPDCVNDDILDLLESLNEKCHVTVEYGIESCYNSTLEKINRGHDFETTIEALEKTHSRGITTGGHMIFGLPGESREEILEEAGILSRLALDHVKFHQLQIVKGSQMGKDYLNNPDAYKEYGLEEYLELVADFLERMRPGMIIERIAGESMPELNMRKSWGIRYDQVLRKFEKLLEERDSWQGKLYSKTNAQ